MFLPRLPVKQTDTVTVVSLVKVTPLFEHIKRLNLKFQNSKLIDQETCQRLTEIRTEKQ